MTDIDARTQTVVPPEGLVTLTHVIYGLHAFSAITGMTSAAFIVTAFLSGWPSIIAVIINYVKRSETRGTYLDSHFGWHPSNLRPPSIPPTGRHPIRPEQPADPRASC